MIRPQLQHQEHSADATKPLLFSVLPCVPSLSLSCPVERALLMSASSDVRSQGVEWLQAGHRDFHSSLTCISLPQSAWCFPEFFFFLKKASFPLTSRGIFQERQGAIRSFEIFLMGAQAKAEIQCSDVWLFGLKSCPFNVVVNCSFLEFVSGLLREI